MSEQPVLEKLKAGVRKFQVEVHAKNTEHYQRVASTPQTPHTLNMVKAYLAGAGFIASGWARHSPLDECFRLTVPATPAMAMAMTTISAMAPTRTMPSMTTASMAAISIIGTTAAAAGKLDPQLLPSVRERDGRGQHNGHRIGNQRRVGEGRDHQCRRRGAPQRAEDERVR